MLTLPSSCVLQFPQPKPKPPTWKQFNRWREDWISQILANANINHRAKTVAVVIYLHLRRETGEAFPGYAEIARRAGIRRQNAITAVKQLVAAGYLHALSRQDTSGDASSNLYVPVGVVSYRDQGWSHLETTGWSHPETLTYIDSNRSILNPKFESRFETQEESEESLPRREISFSAETPSVSPSHISVVPRAAAPGIVPRADEVLVRYDSREWDLVERFGRRALGRPFPRSGRATGIYLACSEVEAIKALAAAEGAV
jgi:hypothetical protein